MPNAFVRLYYLHTVESVVLSTDSVSSEYFQYVECKDTADCTLKIIASKPCLVGLLSLESKWSPGVSVSVLGPAPGQGAQR